ncbi:lantibiotic dehydratase [Actinokineospora sp.]|uniref:lantibiotic dehydratase n=1 Tax=Actinokineospora sp. TaxID=1872133 RepID=UPI0040381B4F
MYRFVDAAVVRAAAQLPTVPAQWPDLTDTSAEGITRWRLWLRQVWTPAEFAAAVEVASPVLARRVQEICDGKPRPDREIRRAVLSTARYLLRCGGRVTLFGLFAGVAPVAFGTPVVARVGDEHRVATRVDTTWLTTVITRLENDPELRRRLSVVVNNVAFVRDGKLVISYRQAEGGADSTPTEVSVRYLDAFGTIIAAARTPVVLGDLANTLSSEYPTTSASVIDRVLADLVTHGILITSLRSPTTSTDPLAHLIEALAAADVDTAAGPRDLLATLRGIHADLSTHDQATAFALDHKLRDSTSTTMAATARSDRPVALDLRLDADVVLPEIVARETEAAAAVLVRLTPEPFGSPSWQSYHGRFLERFGVDGLVPVIELVNADTGLGYPAGYRDSRLPPPAERPLSDRDTALLALVQNAVMRGHQEIVLDEALIAELAVDDLACATVQPHTQLRVRVHASTLDALHHGDFELAVTGVSRAAGVSAGRFLDLFHPADRDRISKAYQGLPTITEDALLVQASAAPLYPRAENVARNPAVLPNVLSLAEHPAQHPGTQQVLLGDLAVTADARRLYLVSRSRRRAVEPVLFSAVEFAKQSHPLLRFLCEVSTARTAACTAFSWGAAARLPFLPRLRYRRTILSPARWLLTSTDLPGPDASRRDWADSLGNWQRSYRVPDEVYVGESDRRLRLDLAEPAHQHLLRAELDRAGQVPVREAPDAGAFDWIDGRAHEIVIPLAATTEPVPRREWPRQVISREHGHLPAAGGWLYVKLYGHPDRHNTILTSHLPALLSTLDDQSLCWFLRYHDPDPHLRLRIQIDPGSDFGHVATRVGAWTAGLREKGLIGQVHWDTYYPETGRFGHGAAMTAAETVFAADSAAAIAQLAAASHPDGPHQDALVAASMVDLAIGVTGDVGAGLAWLIDHVRVPSVPAPARQVHDEAIRLANPHEQAALRALPGGDRVAATWTRRRTALTVYRAALTAHGIAADTVLADLLHLHHVRMAGVSPDHERVCGRLARTAALSWTRRITSRTEAAS